MRKRNMSKREINIQLRIRRILLVLLDCICITFAGLFALATRFEFVVTEDYLGFMWELFDYLPVFVAVTLFIFLLFRIYSSLWEYAGLEEVYILFVGCLC